MSYNVIIQPEAEYDIQDTFEWYESQNPGLGSEFVRAVDGCFSGIARNPLAYQVIHKQVRRSLASTFTYIYFYFFDQDTVFVLAALPCKTRSKTVVI